ncbi:biopolymer transporter ExbD [Peredibacter starrii]|uniref:Biopolymer transporter ExbD n=1 Tax=Peredibacter starrii TaxID=28202 RepID=A0AAX4HUL1_9BACT|nr:biopolymer transporter ExbD [Peredibacter starrii]WPU67071.1 biopolymer transporter ExbD [Peredibacter starrii]
MKKKFTRHKEREAVDVDITSLLDILTILLVFLLKSYNASDLKLDLQKGLEMADSDARTMTRYAPVVQVNKEEKVFLNNKEIGRMPASGEMPVLTEALKKAKAGIEADNAKKAKNQQTNTELVNLVFDKDMDYAVVQRVMHDSALAGYSQFKFIVKGNY